MRNISSSIQKQINDLSSSDFSVSKIASSLGVSRATVCKYSCKKTVTEKRKNDTGRPTKLSGKIIGVVLRQIRAGLLRNATEAKNLIQRLSDTTVSKWTVARLLKASGFKSYAKPKKPALDLKHIKNRLAWARLMKNFLESD